MSTSSANREEAAPWLLKLSQIKEDILSHEEALTDAEVSYDRLDRFDLKVCLLFLSIFPQNEVLKKRPLIYWWIGEGLINSEEEGEKILEELLKSGLIMPYANKANRSLGVSKFEIHPWIRFMFISKAKKASLFDFDDNGTPLFQTPTSRIRRACLTQASSLNDNNASGIERLRTVFNVNKQYLDFESDEWVAKLKNLVVLQLGRWQKSLKHHIEVESDTFLRGLRTQKHLRYLSLRGISLITELPPSIAELVRLEILDLKACHNLEKLPDIASLKRLTHLNVSECYFLESMPKGLKKLASLQVLKGFIIGNSMAKSTTPSSLYDLTGLKNLKRLSIQVGSETMIPYGEFLLLEDISSLTCLRISYSVISNKLEEQIVKQPFSFPPLLEKLELEGIPYATKPEGLEPSELKNLKMLSIKGGKLKNLGPLEAADKWTSVKILRLKYLKDFEIKEKSYFKALFPCVIHDIVIKYEKKKTPTN